MDAVRSRGVDPRPVVVAVQNDPTDPPLLFGEWFVEDGLQVDLVAAYDKAVGLREVEMKLGVGDLQPVSLDLGEPDPELLTPFDALH